MTKTENSADPTAVRKAMRSWTSGITIVTTRFEDRQHGMTVSSFTSVSLTPPILMVSLQQDSRTHSLIMESGVFGVSVLEASQKDISERFAGRTPDDDDRFVNLEVFKIITGSPFIKGGMAFFDCRVRSSFIIGAHTVFFGEVIASKRIARKSPLIYHNQHYHSIGSPLMTSEGV